MAIAEDSQIADGPIRVRLAELKVEETKVNADAEVRQQRIRSFHNPSGLSGMIVICGSILATLVMCFKCHYEDELEKTKRLPELTLQKVEKTKQLQIILDISRNSETDDLAIKAFETFEGPEKNNAGQ